MRALGVHTFLFELLVLFFFFMLLNLFFSFLLFICFLGLHTIFPMKEKTLYISTFFFT